MGGGGKGWRQRHVEGAGNVSLQLGMRESGLGTCGAGGTRRGRGRVLASSSSAMGHVTCDACVMCRWRHRWRQGRGVVIYRVGVHGGVAVGQGRERRHGVRMYTSTSLPPHPLSRPWPTVEKGRGVAVGWKEGGWR